MKGQNGVKSWYSTCPICGQGYRHTNFMVRYLDKYGNVMEFYERNMHPERVVKRTDTHQLACQRKVQPTPTEG